MDHRFHARVKRSRSAEVTFPLLRHPSRQVAGATAAMHRLSRRGQPEPFLGPLMCFHFAFASGHVVILCVADALGAVI